MSEYVVLLREPTGRVRVAYAWGGVAIEDIFTGVCYLFTEAVETSHGVRVLVADRQFGPERW